MPVSMLRAKRPSDQLTAREVSLRCSRYRGRTGLPFLEAAVLLLVVVLLPVVQLDAQDPRWQFYRGVNLNGPAVVIDGNRWEADRDAKNFVCKDQRFENQKVRLTPATDDARARVIRSSRWRSDGNNAITLTNLPKGTYRVYLYNWEDTESQKFSVSLEGHVVLSNHDSGRAGTWKKLGPWDVTVNDGSLQITCRGGHANLSGLEVWRSADTAAVAKAARSGRPTDSVSARARSGLLALYTFDSGSGETIRDRSGGGRPLDLKIEKPSGVAWQGGRLVVRSATRITSTGPATKIINAVKRSGEITIEAWMKPASDRQSGPARIVTLSGDPNQRNFTLGQDGRRFDVRLRTRSTSKNGIPSTTTANNVVKTGLTHVVYTRDRSGTARIYVNGRQQAAKRIAGKLSNWQGSFRLALANELTGDRPWLGEFNLVAIYSRALSPSEVGQLFKAGPVHESQALARDATDRESPARRAFEANIAPIFARHCLECHDSATKKSRLDLSRKATALAGGASGKVIVPGKVDESLLWELVEADEMPSNRLPLSEREKKLLREWIDAGAVWPIEVIDPAIYAQDEGARKVWVQRLTVPEYIETVRSAVGVDIAEEARRTLPADVRADGFSNTAYNLNVDLKHVEAYTRLAEIIVSRMNVKKFARRFSKSRSLEDKAMSELVAKMGEWLLRGPLDEHEIVVFRGIASTVSAAGGDFNEAVRYTIEAMLQSPRFIYRIERQRGDGTRWPVSDYELASRLSYIIWGGPPDEELMRAADTGELSDRQRCAAQVQRMLQDRRAVQRSRQFIAQWLNLDRLDNLRPNPKKFPNWSPELAADMRAETLAFFEDVVWKQKRPMSDLLNAQVSYLTQRLAKHYGLKPVGVPPSGGEARANRLKPELQSYDLSKIPGRGGLLTQGSVLTVGGDEASMVARGLFILKDLLRGTVKDPPPCVDTTPVPTKRGLTQRAIAEARIADLKCGVCHGKFEPLAFGLEKFDGLGAYYEVDEHGNKLRDDGEILFPGSDKPVAYNSAAELMNLLAGSDRVRECITWKLTQFAIGRPLAAGDPPIVRQIHQTTQKNGGTYRSLITAIVLSDLVQTTRTEKEK